MQDILGASADKLTSQDWNRSCLELRCPFPILLRILKHRQFILVCLKILDHLYISLISLPCFFFFWLFFWLTHYCPPQETERVCLPLKLEGLFQGHQASCGCLSAAFLLSGGGRSTAVAVRPEHSCSHSQLTPGHMLSWSHYMSVPSSSCCVIGICQRQGYGKNSLHSVGKVSQYLIRHLQ